MAKECAVSKLDKGFLVCDETRSGLIPALQEIQDKKGYISDNDMQAVADKFGIHPVEVYSVATFYSFLTTRKRGRHVIRISECISNTMAGSRKIEKEFEKALGIKISETTKNNKITLERTGCIGMCDKAPAAMIDDALVGNITVAKVREIIKSLK
ncbi:MAG: NAD(P)H-dependent oxidoreductase subunit E [Candidatus Omnitrophica bacterium]|nr:NAD(P)H-dependent oxidoreductase subunit E [Candidatus Omnitrophota bacterium]